MRISDWSSDVCSSDLVGPEAGDLVHGGVEVLGVPLLDQPELVEAPHHRPERHRRDRGIDVRVGLALGLQAAQRLLGAIREVLLAAHPGVVHEVVVARHLFDDAHDLAVRAVALEVAPVGPQDPLVLARRRRVLVAVGCRSEEHTSELQSLMRISYAVFCLKKKTTTTDYATATVE